LSFRDFVAEASSLVSLSCEKLSYKIPEELEWDFPPTPALGDLSFRTGYQLARVVGKSPGEIVANIAKQIEETYSTRKRYVLSAEGHPSGFLNFRLNANSFFPEVLNASLDQGYGKINLGMGSSVLVEHTSVNPNKALHVGHLRNVALGDSISRVLVFTNHVVRVLNYVDDSGLQVADVIVGIKYLGLPSNNKEKKFDHYAGDDIYVLVNKKYETDSSLAEKRKIILKGIEERDPEIFPLATDVTNRILREQLKTCWRFHAYYDLLVFESDIISSRMWGDVFSALKEKGIAKLETSGTFQGCWIVTIKGEKEGEDKVLVRSDGTATYVAKDIPFAALKIGLVKDRFAYLGYSSQPNGKALWRTDSMRDQKTVDSPVEWGAEKSITAIGSEQSRLQRVILRVLEQLSGQDLSSRYIHLAYSLMTLSSSTVDHLLKNKDQQDNVERHAVRMSGRKGIYINADDVLDALKRSALVETKKRNPELNDQVWFDEVSEKIAIAAIRFTLLKQDLDKTITFDLEESLKLVGETGPYMLYTYARANSILSKTVDSKQKIDAELLNSKSETDIMTLISKFDLMVEKAAKFLAPKWIAHYAFELCESFNKFYELNRVLQVEQTDLRNTRIALVRSFCNVLEVALGLLGIDVLSRI
jgi:arginyl-tRNA synthetase